MTNVDSYEQYKEHYQNFPLAEGKSTFNNSEAFRFRTTLNLAKGYFIGKHICHFCMTFFQNYFLRHYHFLNAQ